jgi:hypothetical protein
MISTVQSLCIELVKLRESWLSNVTMMERWADDLDGGDQHDDETQTMLVAMAAGVEGCADDLQDIIDEHCIDGGAE